MSKRKPEVDQAAAVPYRTGESGIEFCLITSRNSGRWGFPKGRIQAGQTPRTAAIDEALEEAGLLGRIVGEPLGRYSFVKGGRRRTVVALLMEVATCLDDWLEKTQRERRWVTPEAAAELLDRPHLLDLLHRAATRLGTTIPAPPHGRAAEA